MADISIVDTDTVFECDENDTILRAALRSGHGMPYSCNVGSCGNCKFELVQGQVSHVRNNPPAWSERDQRRNKWLGCQARPTGPCTIKFRADQAYIPKFPAIRRNLVLQSRTPITHDIHEFRFAVEPQDDFLPGQYALLSIDGVEGQRAYSMCNLPGEGTWGFQIKKVTGGSATPKIFELRPGDIVGADGPYGTAYLDTEAERDIILLAGGSGLSPMVSIARGALAANILADRKLHFYYGCRSEVDRIDLGTFDGGLAENVVFTTALSDAPAAENSRQGFLNEIVREDFGESLKNYEIYFAGPPLMSASIQKLAYELGVPAEQLHFDEFL